MPALFRKKIDKCINKILTITFSEKFTNFYTIEEVIFHFLLRNSYKKAKFTSHSVSPVSALQNRLSDNMYWGKYGNWFSLLELLCFFLLYRGYEKFSIISCFRVRVKEYQNVLWKNVWRKNKHKKLTGL